MDLCVSPRLSLTLLSSLSLCLRWSVLVLVGTKNTLLNTVLKVPKSIFNSLRLAL